MITAQLLLLTFLQTCIFAPHVIGFLLAYQVTKRFDFTFAAYFCLGAFTSVWIVPNTTTPTVFQLGLAAMSTILICLIFAVIAENFIYWPLVQRTFGRMRFLVASIGMYTIVENIVAAIFGDASHQVFPGLSQKIIYIFTLPTAKGLSFGAIIGSIASFIGFIIIKYTKLGLVARAVIGNPELAVLHGSHLRLVYSFSIGIGATLAGLSGLAFSMDSYVVPTIGIKALVMSVVVALASKDISVGYAIIWIIVLLGLENTVSFLNGPRWAPIITYSIFLVLAIIVGKREQKSKHRGL